MFDISRLFVGQAWAQAADMPGVASPGGLMDYISPQMMMFAAIFMVFYVLVIRPQQKKADAQEKMIKALRRGDRVVTSGGICGKIAKLDNDDFLTLEVADGVNIKVARVHVVQLEAKTDPAMPVANDTDMPEKKTS